MTTITLDTNVLPGDALISAAERLDFEFAAVSVTRREVEGSDFEAALTRLRLVPETGVWDESRWDEAVWGSAQDGTDFEAILEIISGSTFPKGRQSLSDGHRRQLRDAMIFLAHVREKRNIFVTNDARAFIHDGRREILESKFGTRIMTEDEFLAYCTSLRT